MLRSKYHHPPCIDFNWNFEGAICISVSVNGGAEGKLQAPVLNWLHLGLLR